MNCIHRSGRTKSLLRSSLKSWGGRAHGLLIGDYELTYNVLHFFLNGLFNKAHNMFGQSKA